MNRTTGLLITFCVFAFSMTLTWLTGTRAERGAKLSALVIPAAPPAKGKPDFSTPANVLAHFEQNLHGVDETVTCSDEELDWVLKTTSDDAAIKYWAKRWIVQNPASVLAWIERHGGTGRDAAEYLDKVRHLFDVWAAIDLESALTAAARPSWPPARAQALYNVLPALWRTDPQRARVLYEQNLELMANSTSLYASLGPGDEGRGAEFLAFLQSLSPGKGRSCLLSSALMQFRVSNTGIAFWEGASPELKQELVLAGYTPFVISAGDGMDELQRVRAESTGDPDEYRSFLSSYGGTWAARDLPAALTWTREHLKGNKEALATEQLFRGAAAGESFDSAVRQWQSLPSGNVKARLAGAMLAGAPENRRQSVESLINTLSPAYQEMARDAATKRHGRFPQLDMRRR
jgi:hypothetical protein